jgi:hypothetical protein
MPKGSARKDRRPQSRGMQTLNLPKGRQAEQTPTQEKGTERDLLQRSVKITVVVAKEFVSSRKTEINPGDWRKDSSGWLGYPPQARSEQSTVMGAVFTDSPDEFASHRQCEMGIERLGVN